MKVFVVGAGQVGSTIVEALHGDHEMVVVDQEAARLTAIAYRYDVATFEGNGASRKTLTEAGISGSDLVIACTSRDEVNLVAGAFARIEAPGATTVIRTSNTEYVELWREGRLDLDFVVCSELETANAIARVIGVSAAVQTDVFADGQVQIVEFDVEPGGGQGIVDSPLREARIPHDSKVASIIRGESMTLPGGDDVIHTGDRIVVIGSPEAARHWGEILAPWETEVTDVVVFGGGRVGMAIARALVEQRIAVRLIEPNRERARDVAEALPDVRVYNATGFDPEFLERERIGRTQAAIFAMRDDAKN
ncbi:MAG: NAD-binding protein, partial [Thermoleophilia bacterium]|nr:NAD-binding protein [Thermoleophilia bacterium]